MGPISCFGCNHFTQNMVGPGRRCCRLFNDDLEVGSILVFFEHRTIPAGPGPVSGLPFQFNAVAVLCYAGNGKWCYEEDLYNAAEAERVMTAHAGARQGGG